MNESICYRPYRSQGWFLLLLAVSCALLLVSCYSARERSYYADEDNSLRVGN